MNTTLANKTKYKFWLDARQYIYIVADQEFFELVKNIKPEINYIGYLHHNFEKYFLTIEQEMSELGKYMIHFLFKHNEIEMLENIFTYIMTSELDLSYMNNPEQYLSNMYDPVPDLIKYNIKPKVTIDFKIPNNYLYLNNDEFSSKIKQLLEYFPEMNLENTLIHAIYNKRYMHIKLILNHMPSNFQTTLFSSDEKEMYQMISLLREKFDTDTVFKILTLSK